MSMRARSTLLALLALALIGSGAVASAASAAPVWEFGGKELKTTETIEDSAETFSLTIPGAKVTCAHVLPQMTIQNSGGTGKAEFTTFPMFECTTSSMACTVTDIEARKLPWAAHLTTVVEDYLVVEKIEILLVFSGELCALAGEQIKIKGSTGGIINNVNHTITFDKKTESATGTSLKVGSTAIEFTALFATEALGAHKGEGLEG